MTQNDYRARQRCEPCARRVKCQEHIASPRGAFTRVRNKGTAIYAKLKRRCQGNRGNDDILPCDDQLIKGRLAPAAARRHRGLIGHRRAVACIGLRAVACKPRALRRRSSVRRGVAAARVLSQPLRRAANALTAASSTARTRRARSGSDHKCSMKREQIKEAD